MTDILARGSGVAGRAFFVVAAAGSCIYYMRQSPWLYITMSLWFWTVTPLARRLVDYHAGFDPVNYILGVPEFLSLLMVWNILNSRELMRVAREPSSACSLPCPSCTASSVSFVQGQVVSRHYRQRGLDRAAALLLLHPCQLAPHRRAGAGAHPLPGYQHRRGVPLCGVPVRGTAGLGRGLDGQ